MCRAVSISPSFDASLPYRPSSADVARDIEEAFGEAAPDVLVELGVFGELLDGLEHLLAEGVVGERRARDADDREPGREPPVVGQPVERGHELPFREVAIRAEDHDDALGHAPLEAQRVLKRIFDSHRVQHSMR